MKSYSLAHLADHTLLHDLAALVAQDRTTTAALLAHIAEVDARRLYLPAGYPSMFAYCVRELHLCEQAAFTRIRAARAARQFPGIFPAVAAGRLHLSAIVLLAPCLTRENAEELLAAATHKSKAEIEQLLAQRFPRPDMQTRVRALATPLSPPVTEQLAPEIVEPLSTAAGGQLFPGIVEPSTELAIGPQSAVMIPRPAAGQIERSVDRPKLTPLAPRRFALQLTMSQELHDKLRYAQQLLSHKLPSGNVAEVLERALDALIPLLEKRKFAATDRPRAQRRPTTSPRHVPAQVRRTVWERDGGQCTFVSESGCRCPARTLLEFDHIDEVARGGQATVARMRLRCRAHNQYGAERTFGVEFMRHKREASRGAAEARASDAALARTGRGSCYWETPLTSP